MNTFFTNLKNFFNETASDERLPVRDKKVILILLALIISPVDFVPDWIPLYGLLDDLIYLGLICDYFINVVDQQVLLSHYPWGMKSFARIRRIAGIPAFFVPSFIADNLWKYIKEPF